MFGSVRAFEDGDVGSVPRVRSNDTRTHAETLNL